MNNVIISCNQYFYFLFTIDNYLSPMFFSQKVDSVNYEFKYSDQVILDVKEHDKFLICQCDIKIITIIISFQYGTFINGMDYACKNMICFIYNNSCIMP